MEKEAELIILDEYSSALEEVSEDEYKLKKSFFPDNKLDFPNSKIIINCNLKCDSISARTLTSVGNRLICSKIKVNEHFYAGNSFIESESIETLTIQAVEELRITTKKLEILNEVYVNHQDFHIDYQNLAKSP